MIGKFYNKKIFKMNINVLIISVTHKIFKNNKKKTLSK